MYHHFKLSIQLIRRATCDRVLVLSYLDPDLEMDSNR
jgi:hypothetical protein